MGWRGDGWPGPLRRRDYLTVLNTAPEHGCRGRQVEYTIDWPIDDRSMAGIEHLADSDWGAAVDTDGEPDPAAQVSELTGVLRRGPGGDRLATWPTDMRVMTRRTPRPAGKPAKLGEHPEWEYGAFVTHTPAGRPSSSTLTTAPRPTSKTGSRSSRPAAPAPCPRVDYGRNAAWLQLAALATTLTAWLRHIGLDCNLTTASTTTLRFRLLFTPARLITHTRRRILKIPPGWAWSTDLATAWDRLQTLHPT